MGSRGARRVMMPGGGGFMGGDGGGVFTWKGGMGGFWEGGEDILDPLKAEVGVAWGLFDRLNITSSYAFL